MTDDGRYLVISLAEGFNENAIYYRDLGAPGGGVVRLLDDWDALYTFVGNQGSRFFIHTNKGASRNRLIAIDLRNPEPSQWEEIIPETDETLESVSFIGGAFVAQYLRDANSLVRVCRPRTAP